MSSPCTNRTPHATHYWSRRGDNVMCLGVREPQEPSDEPRHVTARCGQPSRHPAHLWRGFAAPEGMVQSWAHCLGVA